MEQRCGECQECVKICPVSAFTGRAFVDDEPREARYDARKCQEYILDLEKKTGRFVCGMCLYICPYGRKGKAQDLQSMNCGSSLFHEPQNKYHAKKCRRKRYLTN
jgi:epoxyqueuosine reductase QueG